MSASEDAQLEELPDSRPLVELTTSLRRDLLVAIDGLDSPSGLDLKRVLEHEYGGETEVHHGRLYPELDRLAEAGFVEKRKRDSDNRTNSYALTDGGKRALDAHRRWIGQAEERDR